MTKERFHPDQAIKRWEDDRLDLKPFVRRLTSPIVRASPESSLVIGLYGEWGHGKTSALNLLELELKRLWHVQRLPGGVPEPIPLVVRFTPWLYSDVNTLLAAFFETLASSVGGMAQVTEDDKRHWRAALRGMGEFVAPAIKLGAVLMAGPAGGAGAKAAIALAGAVAETLSSGLKGSAAAMEGGEVSFHQRKEEAAGVLASMSQYGQPVRVVVLIDDLDRSTGTEEVLAMLKLVRLVADLPNVTYVVAMHRERVEATLRRVLAPDASGTYLDKIIQVPVTLPPTDAVHLSRFVVEEAVTVAQAAGLRTDVLEVRWDAWAVLRRGSYETVLRPALRTLRDAVRVLNAFRFIAMSSERSPVVHAADLLLVATLQALFADVYDRVRRNREFLLNSSPAMSSGATDDWRKGRIAEIAGLEAYPERSAEDQLNVNRGIVALRIVEHLFPNAIYGARPGGLTQAEARAQGRIQSSERFIGYFRLEASADEASKSAVAGLYTLLTSQNQPGAQEAGADAVVALAAAVEAKQQESLWAQIKDRAESMTVEEAHNLSRLLPELAALSSPQIPKGAVEGLATHAYETIRQGALTSDEDAESAAVDESVALGVLLDVITGLPAVAASEFADDLTRGGVPTVHGDQLRRTLAAAGLKRIGEILELHPNVFESFGSRGGVEIVWLVRRLAHAAGAAVDNRYPPLAQYLDRLLRHEPTAIDDIIATAAGWGDRPTFQHRPAEEALAVLDGLLPVARVVELAHGAVQGRERSGNWPQLLREFTALVPLPPPHQYAKPNR